MFVIGADECGLGAWAGPLVICAALVPEGWTVEELNDSKKLKRGRDMRKITRVFNRIINEKPFVQWFEAWVEPKDVDRLGIRRAQLYAFRQTVTEALKVQPDARVVIDGTIRLKGITHEAFPRADGQVPAVMAASVLAKVLRDRYMQTEADAEYPAYGFANHVGYGTDEHREALDKHGPTEIHRMSYEPVFKRAGVVAG